MKHAQVGGWFGFFPLPLVNIKEGNSLPAPEIHGAFTISGRLPRRERKDNHPSLEAMSILPLQETAPSTDFPSIKS